MKDADHFSIMFISDILYSVPAPNWNLSDLLIRVRLLDNIETDFGLFLTICENAWACDPKDKPLPSQRRL